MVGKDLRIARIGAAVGDEGTLVVREKQAEIQRRVFSSHTGIKWQRVMLGQTLFYRRWGGLHQLQLLFAGAGAGLFRMRICRFDTLATGPDRGYQCRITPA